MSATVRRVILVAGIAGIAATGAIGGALLKSEQEVKQARKKQEPPQQAEAQVQAAQAAADPMLEQRIAALQSQRAKLVGQKLHLEKKLEALAERRKASEEKEARRETAREAVAGK